MVRRKGMGLGRGRGYKNLLLKDPKVHKDSAKGRKQPKEPKFIPYKSRQLTAKDREKLTKISVQTIIENNRPEDIANLEVYEGAEIVADNLDDFQVYSDRYGNEHYIVKNIKGRGFPDWDDVKDEVAKQMGVSREYVDEHLTDEFLDNLFWDDVRMVTEDIEYLDIIGKDDKFVVVGRSGGYWGLDFDWDMVGFDKKELAKQVGEFIKTDGNRIAKEARERRGDYGKAMTKKEFEQAFADDIDSEIEPNEEVATISEEYKKTFKELNQFIEGTIDDFENKDRWVETILANEYVPEEKTPMELAQENPAQTRLGSFAKTKKKTAKKKPAKKKKAKFNEVNQIIAYESGELNDVDTLELFSHLLKNGHAWSLQGHYGRTASALIDDGFLTRDGKYTGKAKDFIEVNG